MPVSNANVQSANMELGPVRLKFGGVDLGGTGSNCVIKPAYKKAVLKADQLGETDLDRRISGFDLTLETVLLETQLIENWKVAFPNMNFITQGGQKAGYFVSKIGESDLAKAQVLLAHPLEYADADLSKDVKFFKACPESATEVTYGPTQQRGLKVVFKFLPDFTTTPAQFMFLGDPAVGAVAATAAAAVAGANTGNGTVSAPVAYSGFTKTETITLTCVGVPGANQANFSVTGSVSGALGVATLGLAFVKPQISFTISDGTTDFIIGDSFTIATVAANYA